MVSDIHAVNVPFAYSEMLWFLHYYAKEEDSRNGPVMSVPDPVQVTILRPDERVLFDSDRDANPFFHVMEFIWMMSGSNDLEWIKRFNSGMGKYSDDQKTLPASYGYRWREYFGFDQLATVVEHLRGDPGSRRAVLGMWDPKQDLDVDGRAGLDRPCNTQVYLRQRSGSLAFTVLNRSNDAFWGMMGANVVHMTMLHELLARSLGWIQGPYRVFTNNLHYYKTDKFMKLVSDRNPAQNPYIKDTVNPYPLLRENEPLEFFFRDAEDFVNDRGAGRCRWFDDVAAPMYDAYLNKRNRNETIARISATDWQLAAQQWAERRQNG